jgi:hypothetical protein
MRPKEQLKKGYEGFNVPDNFEFPSCGVEDVDRALFELFDKKLAFEVKVNEQTTKVPVVFAAGERFALTRRQKPIRDRNNALILPLIAIKRNSIGYKTEAEAGGTAISFRQNADYVIKKRLDPSDRVYQNVVNKLSIKNQDNVTSRAHFIKNDISPGNNAFPGTVASRRNGTGIAFGGGKLAFGNNSDLGNNIFEVITIPYPVFVQLNYNVTFWTQYMSQMNQILETLLMKTDGQGREFHLVSNKGFTFTAFLQGSFTSGDNFDNFTDDERIIRYSFDIRVPAYILAPRHPGLPTPFRKFQSAPTIEFEIKEIRQQVAMPPESVDVDSKINAFILTDINILNDQGILVRPRDESPLRAAVDTESGREYQTLVTRDPRRGEEIDPGRIVKDIEDTKI